MAAELARVKAQLKEAETRAASSRQAAPPSGASDLAGVEAELSALKSENAALKAAAAAAPAAAGAGGDVAELKAKLEAAERENAALKGQLKQKDQEIDDLNTAARVAASCVTASRPHSRSPLAAQPRFLQPRCTRRPAPPLRRPLQTLIPEFPLTRRCQRAAWLRWLRWRWMAWILCRRDRRS